MLTTLAIASYRSLRRLLVPLKSLNVITGANGSGKSNLYRALRLLADTAQGRVVTSLAREGGLPSTVTHAKPLISALRQQAGCHSVTLEKKFGETRIEGAKEMNLPVWNWPGR